MTRDPIDSRLASALPRRGFLRALAGLPFIGGGVALLGNPVRAAVPATPALLDRYIAWLANEHANALFHRDPPAPHHDDFPRLVAEWDYARRRQPLYWFPPAPDIERLVAWSDPRDRAAVVLAAAGVPLVGPEAAWRPIAPSPNLDPFAAGGAWGRAEARR